MLNEVYHRGMAWWPPLGIGLLCLLLGALEPSAGNGLRYERGLVEGGQVWRIITAHLVHAGNAHLWLNVAALWLLPLVSPDVQQWRVWAFRMLLLSLVVGIGLHVFNQGLWGYVGLSGVLHGLYVVVLLHAASRGDGLARVVLAIVVGKLIWEQYDGALGTTRALVELPVIVDAHAYGALGGALAWCAETLRGSDQSARQA